MLGPRAYTHGLTSPLFCLFGYPGFFMPPKPESGARNKTTKRRDWERERERFGNKQREQNMRGNNKALLVRALIFGSHRSSMNSFSRRLHENLISNPSKTSHPSKSLSNFTTKFHFSTPYLQLFQRTLSSSSSSGKALISSTFFLFIILWCFNAACMYTRWINDESII